MLLLRPALFFARVGTSFRSVNDNSNVCLNCADWLSQGAIGMLAARRQELRQAPGNSSRGYVEFLVDYASFLAKTVTLVVAIVIVLIALASMRRGRSKQGGGHLEVHKLNEFYKSMRERLEQAVLEKDEFKALRKREAKAAKQTKKSETSARVFVLDFDGDIRASAVENLRHEITALLTMATPQDEVVLRLESGGGMVHGYGLAASQLVRIRDAGVPLTVCVDKVAASGGYMMACIGNRILTAPFAILGSIGVVAQLPNVHRLLKKHDVDFEVLTAGEYKRTLTVFGENTEAGRSSRKTWKRPMSCSRTSWRATARTCRSTMLRRARCGWGSPHSASIWRMSSRPAISISPSARRRPNSSSCITSEEELAGTFRHGGQHDHGARLAEGWSRLNEQRFWQ